MRAVGGPLVVTGTDTGVGKTVVVAALAAAAGAAGLRVAVVKPAQTGARDGGEPDARVVARLAGPSLVRTLATYPDPLAPAAAARVAGLAPLELDPVADAVAGLAGSHDLVLVEGAGGLLVPMGRDGWTVADLAARLTAPAVVVARAGLGTLNHTALTLAALAAAGVPSRVVLGRWPAVPGLVHRTNLRDLPGELAGSVPEGAGALPPAAFRAGAPGWLAPALHGRFDPASLRSLGR